MSVQLIQQYHAQVEKITRYSGTRKETAVRKPFHDLLEHYARQKNLELIGELDYRSAIEWILNRYKERKPRDPTIREKFNTYRFADYKEQVVELLFRVTTASVETMKIIGEMPNA
jgi:hypothetical protein